jgi:hypothetical protein
LLGALESCFFKSDKLKMVNCVSASASDFALRAWGFAVTRYDPTRRQDKSAQHLEAAIKRKVENWECEQVF